MAQALVWKLLVVGLGVGAASGMLGIGGGVLVIPALVLLLGFTQQRAVGTSLAMLLPPIGIFAVLRHHRAGNVDWPAAMTMAAAFAIGAYGGATVLSKGWIPERVLRVGFAGFMLYVAANMVFRAERRVWAAAGTVVIAAAWAVTYFTLRTLGRRWERELDLREEYQRRLGEPVAPEYEI